MKEHASLLIPSLSHVILTFFFVSSSARLMSNTSKYKASFRWFWFSCEYPTGFKIPCNVWFVDCRLTGKRGAEVVPFTV